jgi:EAL domain-containing protein (putative c-di-GMP-specific phosphodiesterase class I)
MAVNLSLAQLKRGNELVAEVKRVLSENGLPASDLEFDVTEATLAQLKWTQNEVLPKLRELGVHIAIDDFGSEYSSFDYVKLYGVTHLKIARSFISRSDTDAQTAATVSAIVGYARDVGIGVIAQGVETPQQDALLKSTDPNARAQGFHFSAAVPASAAAALLRRGSI